MYEANGNEVWVVQDGKRELFLTVHPTDTGGTVTVEEQAVVIARVLNSPALYEYAR